MLAPNCRNKLCIWFSSCRKTFPAKVVSPPQTVLGSYAHAPTHLRTCRFNKSMTSSFSSREALLDEKKSCVISHDATTDVFGADRKGRSKGAVRCKTFWQEAITSKMHKY